LTENLNEETYNKIIKWLNDHECSCPICKQIKREKYEKKLEIMDGIFVSDSIPTNLGEIFHFPFVIIVCSDCGCSLFYSAVKMDLI